MQQSENRTYPSTTIGRLWMKIPLVVRSIILGLGISSIGVGIWGIIVTSIPVPWSILFMIVILIFYWKYFSGKWSPSSTRAFRRFCLRQTKLKRSVWIWGLVAAFFIFLFLNACFMLTFRLVEFKPEIFKSLSYINDFPTWHAWLVILGISFVAGICEEVGFRGYMQSPLERKYGPVIGISITSMVFVAAHLHQAWAGGILVQIFIISFMIGYLAYATNSLLPGIIAHVTFDIINVSYWWSDVLGTFVYKPISITGVDSHFIITLFTVIMSTIIFIISISKLLKLKESAQEQTTIRGAH